MQNIHFCNMSTYRCTTCGSVFATSRALGGHRSRGTCRRFDVVDAGAAASNHVAEAAAINHADIITPVEDCNYAHYVQNLHGVPNVTFTITQLLQRPRRSDATHRVAHARISRPLPRCDTRNTYRLHEVTAHDVYLYCMTTRGDCT